MKPATELAERAGLSVDRGVLVDRYLQTSAPDVYAAGDVARFPEGVSGQPARIEHWVVAQRQRQIAASNMLAQRRACELVPFFWSRHYGVSIRYVGHARPGTKS